MLAENIDHTPMTESRAFLNGVIKILPLCFAVLPWGLLAGSMAIQAGLTTMQAIAMSALVFAGAAQLMTLGLVMAGTPALTIIISVFLITTQHLFICFVFARRYLQTTLKKSFDAGFFADG